jgi:hypothetical protein
VEGDARRSVPEKEACLLYVIPARSSSASCAAPEAGIDVTWTKVPPSMKEKRRMQPKQVPTARNGESAGRIPYRQVRCFDDDSMDFFFEELLTGITSPETFAERIREAVDHTWRYESSTAKPPNSDTGVDPILQVDKRTVSKILLGKSVQLQLRALSPDTTYELWFRTSDAQNWERFPILLVQNGR